MAASRAPTRSVPSSSASAAGSCIPSTLPRLSASARARPAHPTLKASIATTNARAPGGQFVLHAKTLPATPMMVTRWAS